jgi:hypothetical protein
MHQTNFERHPRLLAFTPGFATCNSFPPALPPGASRREFTAAALPKRKAWPGEELPHLFSVVSQEHPIMKSPLLTLTLLTLCICCHRVYAETLRQLLNRFDKNGDHRLDEKEFAAAQAAFDLPTKTARGAERAKVAREAVNAAARKFPDADLKYMKRAAQAHLLLTKKAGAAAESVFNIRDQLVPNLAELSTYERFIINRWIGDQRILKTDDAPIGAAPAVSDLFTTFMENNFRIRNSGELISGDPVSDEPAKFSWTNPRGEHSFYTVDAAVLYTPSWLDWQWDKVEAGKVEVAEAQWLPGGRLRPAFEAHISTQDGLAAIN